MQENLLIFIGEMKFISSDLKYYLHH